MERTKIIGSSMEPVIKEGDNIIINKLAYRLRKPRRFEIIVFSAPYIKKGYFIKRIIGLPGERVQIKGGSVYINGEILIEVYGLEHIRVPGSACQEIALNANEYFVLGDNRNDSLDSRHKDIGLIQKRDIIGRTFHLGIRQKKL
jgi:signal peptidase I